MSFKFACPVHHLNQMAVMAGALSQPIRHGGWRELRGCIGVMFIGKRPRPSETQGGEDIKDPFPVTQCGSA